MQNIDAGNIDAFVQQPGHALLVFTEDPLRVRETLDLAVIVPELAQAFAGRFRVGVLLPESARSLQARYGLRRWPAFVVLRDGALRRRRRGPAQLGRVCAGGRALLDAEPTRPPTIGIAVKTAGSRCRRLRQLNATRQGTLMKTLSIPVRVIGPGSQPEEEPLQYLDMPREMNTFRMPLVPERVDTEALSESRDVLAEFLDALEPWDPATGAPGPRLDVSGVSPGSARHHQPDARRRRGRHPDQRSRIRCASRRACSPASGACASSTRDGQLVGDWIEAGSMPEIVIQSGACRGGSGAGAGDACRKAR